MARARKYRQATFCQTLYEYDGPKLILLKTPGTSYIIAVAIIKDDLHQPFYGAEVSEQQLNELASEDFSVRYVFIRPAFKQWFLFDLADLDISTRINLLPLRLAEETMEYLPGRQFFASEFTDEIAIGTAASAKAEERIDVAGNWEISDFSDLYGGYSDLYSFTDGLERYDSVSTSAQTKRMVRSAFKKQWQGGGSYGSFYRSLRVVQSPQERLSLGGFEYHSPGWVDLEGRKGLLDAVKAMLIDFGERQLEITKAYNDVYKYLQVNKLLSLAADRFDRASDVARQVEQRGCAFSEIVPGAQWHVLMKLSDGDQLVATKVLLSLYRRLSRLNEFQLQGRATF